ncbi:probable fructokinase-6, chloroplastic [Asparagus officinalis]|uniref:probable fructokinase-6, chloroplastic n=1 Tax=Asparagus officinalis TaxID=4686 RepID=UPI00098E0991|nr:probable fructokinase-6, chloroplastic [Asparagus officinalis]
MAMGTGRRVHRDESAQSAAINDLNFVPAGKAASGHAIEFHGRVSGVKVDQVDTTGAGDAFVAGILSQLAADISLLQDEGRLRDALKFANACGALTVMGRGAIPALPTRQAVLDALVNIVV